MLTAIILLIIGSDYNIYFHHFRSRTSVVLIIKYIECKKHTFSTALLR